MQSAPRDSRPTDTGPKVTEIDGSNKGGTVTGADEVVAFAEQLLALLDEGRFNATYKYALLLALVDSCLEHSDVHGAPPSSLTTRQIAEKVLGQYWPHAVTFTGLAGAVVLRQNAGRQARIVESIRAFRTAIGQDATLAEARAMRPESFEGLLDEIEWTLVQMPLPRLQTIGDSRVEFLYRIAWDESVTRARFGRGDFDRRVHFVEGAADQLVRLAGLIRPLAQRQWAAMVARLNRDAVEATHLEEFLFGARRLAVVRARLALTELQDGRCFYTGEQLRTPEVDHFLPWTRYPTDAVENLVVCNRDVNGAKRAYLAAPEHVARWARRLGRGEPERAELARIAEVARLDHRPAETVSVARALYLRIPAHARLWVEGRHLVPADAAALASALDVPV